MSEATPNDPGCVRCPHCEGEGYGVRLYMAGPGDVAEESYECGACDGSGIINVDELGLGDLLAELDFAELLDLAITLSPNDEYMDALDHDPPEPGLRKILATLPVEPAMEHARYLISTRDLCDQELDVWAWSTSEQAARGNLIANKLNRFQREHEGRAHMSPKQETLEALALEIERARDKFPSNAHLFLALVEEVGELSKDLLEGNPGWREEALQVACVALRIYEEGEAFGREEE